MLGGIKIKMAATAFSMAVVALFCIPAHATTWGSLTVTDWHDGIIDEFTTSWPGAGTLTVDHVVVMMKATENCSGNFYTKISQSGGSYNSITKNVALTASPQEVVFYFENDIAVADIDIGISFAIPDPNTSGHPCYQKARWGYSGSNTYDYGYIYPYALNGDVAFQVDSGEYVPTPAATITSPEPDQLITQDYLNSASGPYQIFSAITDLDADEYPGLYGLAAFEIYDDDESTLLCEWNTDQMSAVESGGNNYYGASTIYPDTCPPLAISPEGESYNVRAIFVVGGFIGEYSDLVAFRVVPFGYTPRLTCEEEAGWFNFCWLETLANFLFVPSSYSVDLLLGSMGIKCPDGTHNCGLGAKFPFNFIDGTINGFFDALDQTAYDFGEPVAGNPMTGTAPNMAWFAARFKSFYGDWAGPAAVAVIWFAAIAAAVNSGYALANLGSGPFAVNEARADHGGPLTARGELIHFRPDDPADFDDFEEELFDEYDPDG